MSDCPYINIIHYLENLINYKKSYNPFSKKPELHEACSEIIRDNYDREIPIDNLHIEDLNNLLVRFKYLYDESENSKNEIKESQDYYRGNLINSNRINYGMTELKRQLNVLKQNGNNIAEKQKIEEELQRLENTKQFNKNLIKPVGGKRKSKRRKSKKTTNKKGKKNRKSTKKSNKKLSKK